jgi:hypothetical protein
MRKLVFTGLLIVFGSNCFAQKKAEKPKLCITQEEYEIYNVVGVANFQNETYADAAPMLAYFENNFQNISPETVADFREKNNHTYLLRCVNRADGKMDKLRKSTGGNASTSFSRIGFSRDGKEALVHHYWEAVGNYCGGEFVLLRKNVNKWDVVKRVSTVIC